ncbi:MAG: NUDIX domain-containing protein [Ginsengibacter sp.]
MTKPSAGILFYRHQQNNMQVFLVHPGGPYWARKDLGAWSIPKGEIMPGEQLMDTALRETEEETGIKAQGKFIALTPAKQKNGKIVHAWAAPGDFEKLLNKSNNFEMEWPPKSGNKKLFPEIDKGAWFDIGEAKDKIIPGQIPLITELESLLKNGLT